MNKTIKRRSGMCSFPAATRLRKSDANIAQDQRDVCEGGVRKYGIAYVPGAQVYRLVSVLLCILIAASVPALPVRAEEGYDQVAGSSSMGKTREQLAPYGMTPVTGDLIENGEYIVGTECSSSYFHIEEAKITVRDGDMTALLTMSSSSYLLVYPGTAEEAAAAPYEEYIQSVEIDTWDTFTIPVKALDEELDLAAFSKKKKKWYPRKVLFHASDIPADKLRFEYPDYDRITEALALYDAQGGTEPAKTDDMQGGTEPAKTDDTQGGTEPVKSDDAAAGAVQTAEPQAVRMDRPDGEYSIEVSLSGGSGRASVTTPTWLDIQGGRAYAKLLWSSPYYDYVILGGKKYNNETEDGGSSSFTIPITALDTPMEIIADTTAMGDPVEIAYELVFYGDTVGDRSRVPQEGARRVLTGAIAFIAVGGIANYFIKKRRR